MTFAPYKPNFPRIIFYGLPLLFIFGLWKSPNPTRQEDWDLAVSILTNLVPFFVLVAVLVILHWRARLKKSRSLVSIFIAVGLCVSQFYLSFRSNPRLEMHGTSQEVAFGKFQSSYIGEFLPDYVAIRAFVSGRSVLLPKKWDQQNANWLKLLGRADVTIGDHGYCLRANILDQILSYPHMLLKTKRREFRFFPVNSDQYVGILSAGRYYIVPASSDFVVTDC